MQLSVATMPGVKSGNTAWRFASAATTWSGGHIVIEGGVLSIFIADRKTSLITTELALASLKDVVRPARPLSRQMTRFGVMLQTFCKMLNVSWAIVVSTAVPVSPSLMPTA